MQTLHKNTHKFYANISQNYTQIRKITQNDTNTQNNTLGKHTKNYANFSKFSKITQILCANLHKIAQNYANALHKIAQNYIKLRKCFEQITKELRKKL